MEVDKTNWRSIFLAIALAAIAATPPTIMALAAFQKTSDTHDLVNSRMTEMIELVKAAATAQATLKEKAGEQARKELQRLPNRHDKP